MPSTDEKDFEYRMGYDAGMNGANANNCHFSIFSTPEKTKAWERGNADGSREREKLEDIAHEKALKKRKEAQRGKR